jgi:hypothetical protein
MEGYQEISTEILRNISTLLLLGEKRNSGEFSQRLRALKEKLLADHFHIVVMGQFKRGKTTFINSLLGSDILPSSVIPLTSVNTILRYGERPEAEVHYLDGRREKISPDRIAAFVTEKENPENRLQVKVVEVFIPSPYLKDGVCFVDTPGVGSTFLHNDQMAYSYLAHADAVIFMISADPPISRSELAFLHDIRALVGKVFFVQNKIDYLDEVEREESLKFNAQVISEALGTDKVEIFPLSAKTALKASLQGDQELLEKSLLPAFIRRLNLFLLQEKGALLLQSNLKNLLKILSDEIAGNELERSLLLRPLEELQDRISLFEEEMRLLRREKEEIIYLIEGDFKRILKEGLDLHVEEFKKRAIPSLLQRYEDFCAENADLGGSSFQKSLGEFIKQLILDSFTEWRLEEERNLSEEFKKLEKLYRDKANSIVYRILKKAGDIFEIELSTMEAELGLEEEGEFWFKLEDQHSDLEIFMSTVTKSLPKKLSRRIMVNQNRGKLLELFDRHCGRVRYDFYLRLQKSFNSLRVRVYDLVEGTMESVEGSIKRAMERRESGAKDLHPAVEELDSYLLQLEMVRKNLEELNTTIAPPAISR